MKTLTQAEFDSELKALVDQMVDKMMTQIGRDDPIERPLRKAFEDGLLQIKEGATILANEMKWRHMDSQRMTKDLGQALCQSLLRPLNLSGQKSPPKNQAPSDPLLTCPVNQQLLSDFYSIVVDLHQSKRFDEASAVLRILCLLDPSNEAFWTMQGHLHYHTQKYQEALYTGRN